MLKYNFQCFQTERTNGNISAKMIKNLMCVQGVSGFITVNQRLKVYYRLWNVFVSSFQKNHSILLKRLSHWWSLILSKDIGRLSQIALYPDFRALFKIHILEKYPPTSSKWFFFCIVTITKSSFSQFFFLLWVRQVVQGWFIKVQRVNRSCHGNLHFSYIIICM